jgi:sigma-E factor negative regulatory protein RseA
MNAKPQHADAAAEDRHAQLSALADGEAAALEEGCRRWRDDPEARARWHSYQLIGDVLRSEDLASTGARDAAFLCGVRERLALEPVVLAPPPRRVRHWLLPGAAAAAGFVAVAGVLVVLRNGSPAPEAPVAVAQPSGAQVVPAVNEAPVAVIRDPKLERLLAMHRGAGGGFAAVPGATPRNLEVMATTPITPVVAPVSR